MAMAQEDLDKTWLMVHSVSTLWEFWRVKYFCNTGTACANWAWALSGGDGSPQLYICQWWSSHFSGLADLCLSLQTGESILDLIVLTKPAVVWSSHKAVLWDMNIRTDWGAEANINLPVQVDRQVVGCCFKSVLAGSNFYSWVNNRDWCFPQNSAKDSVECRAAADGYFGNWIIGRFGFALKNVCKFNCLKFYFALVLWRQ